MDTRQAALCLHEFHLGDLTLRYARCTIAAAEHFLPRPGNFRAKSEVAKLGALDCPVALFAVVNCAECLEFAGGELPGLSRG
jgi:hypothetical protein